jgi:hypothetical protein
MCLNFCCHVWAQLKITQQNQQSLLTFILFGVLRLQLCCFEVGLVDVEKSGTYVFQDNIHEVVKL